MKYPDNPIALVVDDDPMVRRSLESLLKSVGLGVKTFDSAQKFLETERPQGPSCLILDVRMPGLSGPMLQERLLADQVPLPIIFITGYGTIPMSVRAMKAGAVDFLQKPFNDQELLDAVSKAIERDRERRREKKEMIDIQKRFNSLTLRERDVFALVITGMLNKQVASQLGMSANTVKVHRARVMQKMHAESLADLLRLATKLRPYTPKVLSPSD